MAMTPWGDSERLRERRLRPGPGSVRAEVEQNQRERLFGAMIALVAERGYEATTLNEVAEVSGVSKRSMYQLFDSKRACFEATMQAVVGLAVEIAMRVGSDPQLDSWEEQARAGSRAFAEMAVAQPATTRVCLIDVFSTEPAMAAPLAGAIRGFEEISREGAAMSAEMIGAVTGAIEEIVRTRLLSGKRGGVATADG